MPVIFRGRSEYNRNYKWNSSFRSASFEPKLDQSADDAGLRSDQIVSSQEPRIPAKKKVWHRDSQVQSCLVWWPESDVDDRSSQNADPPAKAQTENASPVIKAYKRKEIESKTPTKRATKQRSSSLDGSIALRARKESVKVVREQNSDLRTSRSRAIQADRQGPEKKSHEMALSRQTRRKESNHKDKDAKHNKPDSVKKISSPQSAGSKRPSPKPKISYTTPEASSKRETSGNQKKSPKKSKQVLDNNIPLQHKAGLHAGKPTRVSRARLSEYQRNFVAPKIYAKSSPVLSALDVVHSSSPAIPPHSGIRFRSTSEYVANYKTTDSPEKFTGSLRKSPTAHASPSLKKKVKDIQKTYFAPTPKKSSKSEYASQYEANSEFQTGELRQMAEKNKQKHEGTHIDPNHATQVVSPLNRCWEASSVGTGETEEPSDIREKAHEDAESDETPDQWSKASQKGSDTTTLGEEETEIEVDSLEVVSVSTEDSVVRKLEWDEEVQKDARSESSKSTIEGRITTPRLQEMGGALRSHHDLTTPCRGGALLISPTHPTKSKTPGRSDVSSKSSRQWTSRVAGAPTSDAQQLLEGRLHPLVLSSPRPAQSGHTPEKRRPASAKEPLVKRESPARSKRPKSSSPFVMSHTTSLGTARAPIRGALKNEEFQHCGPTGRVQTAPAFSRRDEDALSVSSSLTSARASELLRRAKERKSFWTTA